MASPGVEYSFSLISPTMPSSSPPTTPISISMIVLPDVHSSSISSAMVRFSSSSTADPSHMWELNSGSSPRATRSREISASGRMKVSRWSAGQWSVCSATCTGKDAATTLAYPAKAVAPTTMSLTVNPDQAAAPPVETCTMPSDSASAKPRNAARSVCDDVTLMAG